MGEIIKSQCSCGEPISIEIGADPKSCRKDGKRPFYPDETNAEQLAGTGVNIDDYPDHLVTSFSCRKCGGWLADTVPGAHFEEAL
ncbi:hypothetical protein [Buttiauxella gaviniae]|uniref:hypothetical protein n=1 Tax=Buttiauxella gaviniae TaxID=82990 RepID=UPI0039B0E27B